MPRVSKEQMELNREAIEAASSKLFRERGFQNVSLVDLMAAAGLTHGGFYGHFESKDALAAVAVDKSFTHSVQQWRRKAATAPSPQDARAAIVASYLSTKSRDVAGLACPVAALATDVSREGADAPVRSRFREGTRALVDILAGLDGSGAAPAQRQAALADLAMMAGALMLARATAGDPMSEEFLAAARNTLLGNNASTPTGSSKGPKPRPTTSTTSTTRSRA